MLVSSLGPHQTYTRVTADFQWDEKEKNLHNHLKMDLCSWDQNTDISSNAPIMHFIKNLLDPIHLYLPNSPTKALIFAQFLQAFTRRIFKTSDVLWP